MDPNQQIVERIKQANNILVTVSTNPSVDQLAACIGMTLAINKLGKHGTAVFSGEVPSTIEFLQPELTIEKNTDSLRDFIISLDKSKADKLRYKVEDKVVKIFITPYRTSIDDKDLNFEQGDFNVDVVLALGVSNQADLDKAVTAHGRILHDATVISVNVKEGSELGSLNWIDAQASSLSEIVYHLIAGLGNGLIDGQIATAILTGIVAETQRFSNTKTTPRTMSVSAELMSAGANQQLVASKLEEPAQISTPANVENAEAQKVSPDTLAITHETGQKPESPEPKAEQPPQEPTPQIKIDERGMLVSPDETETPEQREEPKLILQPPSRTAPMSASSTPTPIDDNFSTEKPASSEDQNFEAPSTQPEFNSSFAQPVSPEPQASQPVIQQVGSPSPQDNETLTDLEKSVHSRHVEAPMIPTPATQPPQPMIEPVPAPPLSPEPAYIPPAPAIPGALDLASTRSAVEEAYNSTAPGNLPPISALNAQRIDLPGLGGAAETQPAPFAPVTPTMQMPLPPNPQPDVSQVATPPPPVPPPMMPPSIPSPSV